MTVPVLARILRALRRPAYARLMRDAGDVRGAQAAALARLVSRLGATRVARRLGAARASSLDALRRLPLTRFDDYADDVRASLDGEADVMVPGRPSFFATTAGTTGASKRLPVDRAYRREFQEPLNAFIHGVMKDHPAAAAGKVLYFVGSAEMATAPSGVPIGAMSGYNFLHLPALVRSLYAAPYDAFTVADAVSRAYAVALLALRHEVSFAVAVTSQPLVQLGHLIRSHADALLRDIADGTLTAPAPLEGAERRRLLPHLRRDPARARILRRRAERAGGLTPAVAWPKLALLSAWFHAGAGVQAPELPGLFGDVPRRSAVYSATEGWFNVPLADEDPSGVLAVGSAVFEFLPTDRGVPDEKTPRFADELEVGKTYELVVTSGAGIWRYRMADEVRCTGKIGQAPLIHFVQKLGNILNIAHDMTSEAHVEHAVTKARSGWGAFGRYCFAEDERSSGGPPRYVLLVDADDVDAGASEHLADAFDRALRVANHGYEDERVDGGLARATVRPIPRERWLAWERARSSQAAGAQTKPITFAKDREAIRPLLEESPR